MDKNMRELEPLCEALQQTAGDRAVVVLHGSRATNDHHEWSDWDVVVITDRILTESETKKLRRTVKLDLDANYYSHNEFETHLHAWLHNQQQNTAADTASDIAANSIDGNCLLGSEHLQRYRELKASWIQKKLIPDPAWSRLVSIEDGLTETQRQIVSVLPHTQARYVKSARVVGDAIDRGAAGMSFIYRSLLSLSRPWTTKYPLIAFQGNRGSEDGRPAAGMRYTECRSSRYLQWGREAQYEVTPDALRDASKALLDLAAQDGVSRNAARRALEQAIGKESDTELPVLFPHLLANGSMGHSRVDSAIPSFPLDRVVDALKLSIDASKPDDQALLDALGAPELATGGVLQNADEVRAALESGVGNIRVSGVCDIRESEREIRIAERAYGATDYEDTFEEAIASKDLVGVSHVENRLDVDRAKIFLKLSKEANPSDVVQQINSMPCMTTELPVNITVLREGKPTQLPIAQLIRHTADRSLKRHGGSRDSLLEEWNNLQNLAR